MTKNQIDYASYKETKRANQAKEAETHRANVANENLGWAGHYETSRHNQVTEGINLMNVNETVRSNKAREAENNRHNLIVEQENNRHNLIVEGETHRSNTENETIAKQRNTIADTSNMLKFENDTRAQDRADFIAQSDLGYMSAQATKGNGLSQFLGGIGLAIDYITDIIPFKGSIKMN